MIRYCFLSLIFVPVALPVFSQENLQVQDFGAPVVDQILTSPAPPAVADILNDFQTDSTEDRFEFPSLTVQNLNKSQLGEFVRTPGSAQAQDQIDYGYIFDQLREDDQLGAALAAQADGDNNWVSIATTTLTADLSDLRDSGKTDELAKALGLMSQAEFGGLSDTPLSAVQLDLDNSQTIWRVDGNDYLIPLDAAPASELMKWTPDFDIPDLIASYQPESAQEWNRLLSLYEATGKSYSSVNWPDLRDKAIQNGSYPQLDILMEDDPSIQKLLSFEYSAESRIEYLQTAEPSTLGFIQLGNIYQEQDEISSAIDSYESALALDPDNLSAQIGLAQIALSPFAGEFDDLPSTPDAIEVLENAQLAGRFEASLTIATATENLPAEQRILASVVAQENAKSTLQSAAARNAQSSNCRALAEAGTGEIKCQFFDIAYITNRDPILGSASLLDFGTERVESSSLSVGVLRNDLVIARTIPQDQPGLIRRGSCIGLGLCVPVEVLLPEASDKGFGGIGTRYEGDLQDGLEESYRYFVERGSRDPERALVFIHGFNTDFREAVDALTNLMITARYPSTPYLVSWPSEGRLWNNDISELRLRRNLGINYPHDRKMVTESCTTMHEALSAVIERYGAGKVDLVIHSMGNQLFFEMLNGCGDQQLSWPVDVEKPFRFLILSAPDVAVTNFERATSLYSDSAERTFIYGTDNDLVLGVSTYINRELGDRTTDDVNRLGFFDNPPISEDGITWINTITVDGFSQNAPLNHSHYINTPPVRRDIAMILNGYDDEGPERCVFPADKTNRFFYISPNCL